jgi:hypothetical protein
MGYTSAQEEDEDNFNVKPLDSSSWTSIASDDWQIVNGTVSSTTGGRSGLIFEKWGGEQYISEVDFTSNDSNYPDYAVPGFYFYYEDINNYGRVVFGDDNRGEDYVDVIQTEQDGHTFTNTQTYINTSTNTSIEFDPNTFHHLKVVRLNKQIYVYFDKRLALTTEFKEENPKGKVGLYVYASTGYFDNFYLHPITMENASGYINELNLTSAKPSTTIGSIYTLRLEDTTNGKAFFSLSKFGKTTDTSVGSEGDTISLNFENGDEAVNFKITQVFDAEENSGVWLEEIISASSDDLNIGVDDISIEPSYYQEEDMDIRFSVKNQGGITHSGTPEIVINTDGDSETINPELVLDANGSEQFNVLLKAPDNPGSHTLTISINPNYTNIEKSVVYQVRALNPAVTTISSDMQEDKGIRGTVSIGSPFPAELVDWNTTAVVKVYRVVDNGKKEIYSRDVPVTGSTFNIDLGYNEFYRGDGQYVVSVDTGGMQDSDLFEIMGEDFAYAPTGDEMPPTILTGELYPKLMMLLIGMFASVSVRNHMHRMTRSLPLDILAVACGFAVLAAAFMRGESDMAASGIVLTGVGVGVAVVKRNDSAVSKLFMMNSHLHDFVGMLLVFASAGYIVMQVPEWNFYMVVGTLVGYYSALNLYRGRLDVF